MPAHGNHPHGGAPPPHPPPKPNQKLLSLILKAIIMTMITTLFFLFLGVAAILLLLATAALHRHTSPSSDSSNGFSLKDLKKLPRFKFSTKTISQEAEPVCVVCLEGIRQGQWCRNLAECGHLFHRKCVDAWLVKVPACPICRTRVRLDHTVEADKPLWSLDWRNDFSVSYICFRHV